MPNIRVKRGNKANMPSTLLGGELAVALDTLELAVGDASGNRQYMKVDSENVIGKGQANGMATLDGSGKVPTSQLPSSVTSYKGAFDATGGSMPASPASGDAYRVSVGGTISSVVYNVGDMIIYNGTTWDKFDGVDDVVSVNGQTGAVSLDTDDIAEGSTNQYFTNGRADARADVRIAAARGAVSGIASLDSDSKVPSSQLPTIDGGTF